MCQSPCYRTVPTVALTDGLPASQHCYHIPMRSGRPLPACVAIMLLWTCAAAASPRPASETADALRARATALIYEHQHDEAIKLLRQAVALAPDQSATHRSLASALWLKMLFLRGAVTVDHYLGSFNRARVDSDEAAAGARERVPEVHHHGPLARRDPTSPLSPKDAQAHYDLGAALGLNASYIASIEGQSPCRVPRREPRLRRAREGAAPRSLHERTPG